MDNLSFTVEVAPAAKVKNAKEKAPAEGVEEPILEGIGDVLKVYMRSLYTELIVAVSYYVVLKEARGLITDLLLVTARSTARSHRLR